MAVLALRLLVYAMACMEITIGMDMGWIPCNMSSISNMTFVPEGHLKMREGDVRTVNIYVPEVIKNAEILQVISSNDHIMSILDVNVNGSSSSDEVAEPMGLLSFKTGIGQMEPQQILENGTLMCQQLSTFATETVNTLIQVKVQGHRLGKCQMSIQIRVDSTPSSQFEASGKPVELPQPYQVVVLRDVGLIDQIFHIVIQVLLGILNFAFGCELDISIVIALLKKPLAPAIGFCSQFLLMPVLGLAITQVLQMDPVFGMGLISLACAPGGGASNAWTILLGGDVNLSLTMTFISLSLALGMMPLWMFVTSRLYFDPSVVRVPYLSIVTTLCTFVGPCFVGVLLKKVCPKVAQPITSIIKPLSIIFLVWVLSVGTYVNLYMWRIMGEVPLTIVAGILLPWCGFALGFGFALLGRQGRERAITIAIETGIQNMGVPIVLLQRSFPQPEGDLAATMVNSVAIFTPLPLFAALILLTVKKRCAVSQKNDNIEKALAKTGDEDAPEEISAALMSAADDVTPTVLVTNGHCHKVT